MISLLLPVLVPMAARQITLKFYGVEQLLTQYTCFANSCKICFQILWVSNSDRAQQDGLCVPWYLRPQLKDWTLKCEGYLFTYP